VTRKSSPSKRAFVFTALALAYSVALVVAALVAPANGSATLVAENGTGVLLVVAVPAVLCAIAWIALWRRAARGGRLSGYVAWACVWVICALCVLGALTIGWFVAPVALLLARAVSLAPSGPAPESRAASAVGARST
jgi:hypothetical protein